MGEIIFKTVSADINDETSGIRNNRIHKHRHIPNFLAIGEYIKHTF